VSVSPNSITGIGAAVSVSPVSVLGIGGAVSITGISGAVSVSPNSITGIGAAVSVSPVSVLGIGGAVSVSPNSITGIGAAVSVSPNSVTGVGVVAAGSVVITGGTITSIPNGVGITGTANVSIQSVGGAVLFPTQSQYGQNAVYSRYSSTVAITTGYTTLATNGGRLFSVIVTTTGGGPVSCLDSSAGPLLSGLTSGSPQFTAVNLSAVGLQFNSGLVLVGVASSPTVRVDWA
jgi:hypothetical protein